MLRIATIREQQAFGTAVSFPFRRTASGGDFAVDSGEAEIRSSIKQILMTRRYERPFLVKNGIPFGTLIAYALFEDPKTAIDIFTVEAKMAVETWESRVYNVSASADQLLPKEPTVIVGSLYYQIRATGRPDSVVVTYDTQKGTVR